MNTYNYNIELIETERSIFADGQQFKNHGSYEIIKGYVVFNIDPKSRFFAGVTDIKKAPKNRKGLVEFKSDFLILRPSESGKGNRSIFFEWVNRGNIRCLQFFNDAIGSNFPIKADHVGNGFLFRNGYTIVFCAWQGDLLAGDDRFLMELPVAKNNGKSIKGVVRSQFILEQNGIKTQPLSGWYNTRSHPTVSMDSEKSILTRRPYANAKIQKIPSKEWFFAREEKGLGLDGSNIETSIVPSDSHIYLPGGFETGWIYELIYTAKDPLIMGLGHPAVRDFISFLRYNEYDSQDTPNPLLNLKIEKVYGWGRSQSGRLIRDFVYQGYNKDQKDRKVFDGLMPHVSGAGMLWMNHRFANTVSPAGQEHEYHENCADRFPFSYAKSTDHLTGKNDSILTRPKTDPLIIHTQSATEYWQRRGSLVHTDTQGNDLLQPENVRIYCWGSSQHFADPLLKSFSNENCQNFTNSVRTSMFFRAMLTRMEMWARDGVLPPPNLFPLRKNGTLLTGEEWRKKFPKIPGIMTPNGPAKLPLLDFGPNFSKGLITKEPPEIIDEAGYTVMVPSVDHDGNDIGCLRAPMVEVPLATYTGWNIRVRGQGHGAMYQFSGSTIPFPETQDEKFTTNDPRRSILERYRDRNHYVDLILKSAKLLEEEGFLLGEDVKRCGEWAQNWDFQRHQLFFLNSIF
tara:strand:- start:425 stop:2470 length:2046 start_codon:yes stop_codon:yes gene_type:complete